MPALISDVAAFERRLAGLPVVKHPAGEVVLTAGSRTGSPASIDRASATKNSDCSMVLTSALWG